MDNDTTAPQRQRAVIIIEEGPNDSLEVNCEFAIRFDPHFPEREVEVLALAALQMVYGPNEGREATSFTVDGKEMIEQKPSALERYLRG